MVTTIIGCCWITLISSSAARLRDTQWISFPAKVIQTTQSLLVDVQADY